LFFFASNRTGQLNLAVENPEVMNVLIVASPENTEALSEAFLSIVFPWNCVRIRVTTSTGKDDLQLQQNAVDRLTSTIGFQKKKRLVPFDLVVLDSNIYRTRSVTSTLNGILAGLPAHRVFLILPISDVGTISKCDLLGLLYVTVPIDMEGLELLLHHTFHGTIAKACVDWMRKSSPNRRRNQRRNSSSACTGEPVLETTAKTRQGNTEDAVGGLGNGSLRQSAPALMGPHVDSWHWSGSIQEASNGNGNGESCTPVKVEPHEEWSSVDLFTPDAAARETQSQSEISSTSSSPKHDGANCRDMMTFEIEVEEKVL
jgi:hypothetical protein